MANLFDDSRIIAPEPPRYTTPEFPSLYWPFPVSGPQSFFLYHTSDIWRFTLYWTLIFYAALHSGAATYAVAVQLFGYVGGVDERTGKQWRRRQRGQWKVAWVIPISFAVIGGLEASVAGSVVGGLLGAIYNAGFFRMSTWIPFVWGLVNLLIVVLSSFAIHGGL